MSTAPATSTTSTFTFACRCGTTMANVSTATAKKLLLQHNRAHGGARVRKGSK